jgi:hypothetical protein
MLPTKENCDLVTDRAILADAQSCILTPRKDPWRSVGEFTNLKGCKAWKASRELWDDPFRRWGCSAKK